MAQKIKKQTSQDGYLIIESLMALLLGATIALTFIFTSTSNLTKSDRLRKELLMKSICEEQMNLLIENPPRFDERLTLTAEETNFEYKEENGSDKYEKTYKIKTTYKRLEIPGLDQIQGKDEQNEDENAQTNQKIMENVKNNIKEMIWQVRIEVIDPDEPDNIFSLSSYLYNDKAMVKIDAL